MNEPREIPLRRDDLDPDPVDQFDRWLAVARSELDTTFPEAAVLSTVGVDGYPQGRIVLLKEVSDGDFLFYTNLESIKARALAAAPRASLCFHWEALWRQVRVQGDTRILADAVADAYFATRPRMSQIGAWASAQSEPLASRAALEARFAEVEERFQGREVPRPPNWGGYALTPRRVEFWQGRSGRLHDRFLYTLADDGSWTIQRLNP